MNHCKNRLNFNIYAVKTLKDEVTCDTLKLLQKIENLDIFPQKDRFRDKMVGRETTSQNRSVRYKTRGLEHMTSYQQ